MQHDHTRTPSQRIELVMPAEFHIHVHHHGGAGDQQAVIIHHLETIMATQAEQAQTIRDLTAQVTKTRNETLAKIAALQAAIDAGGVTSPEVDAAMVDLKAAVQLSDDDEPDAPAP